MQDKIREAIKNVFRKRWPHTQVSDSLIEELVKAALASVEGV